MSKYKTIQTDSHLLLVDENIRGTSGWNYNYGLSKIDNLPYSKEKHSTEWNFCVKIIKASPKLGDLPEFDILTSDPKDITKESIITFNKEEYNKHISDVIKETLRFASQNAEIRSCGNPYDYEDDSKCVDEYSITKSFDEIFSKFKK